MGLAWINGRGRGRASGGRAWRGVPNKHTDRKRPVGRAALHGNGLSSGVLSALSWLLEVLSALGAGAVSKFEEHQQQGGRGRNVNLGAGTDSFVGNAFDPRPILIVTGLAQEARIAAGPGMTVICSSSDPKQLRALLATFDPSSIRGVISFGVAGGLCPSLKSGDVVVATEVMAGDSRWLAGLALSEELITGTGLGRRRVVQGGLAGVEEVVAAQAGKAALRLEAGAVAVDMESLVAADLRQAFLHFGREDVLRRTLILEIDLGGHRTGGANAAQRHPHRLQRIGERGVGRGRLVAAMRHAVGALLVLAGAVGFPIG